MILFSYQERSCSSKSSIAFSRVNFSLSSGNLENHEVFG
ncbi:hypothetical protein LEP1GSC125_0075 [Leptospira mayottensis 200901122]|uniref:Uncharacterized protein n=1 Tax=Leptospira mayottensis 200901122 TaxID=1193010 RepID=A0AA87SZB8_9LEPT|nr:hypothetical protein LEP1GSC125_0075 [Leptospira mayottensis 200901122]